MIGVSDVAYRQPTMPFNCNVWTNGVATSAPPRLTVPCNLTPGRRQHQAYLAVAASTFAMPVMYLLLPAYTDIRAENSVGGADTVEVPAGSGRFYSVTWVDDIGKGFSNEHRFACLVQDSPWAPGIIPIPPAPGDVLWADDGVTDLWADDGATVLTTP